MTTLKKFANDISKTLRDRGYNADTMEINKNGEIKNAIYVGNKDDLCPTFYAEDITFTDDAFEASDYIEWLINGTEEPQLTFDYHNYEEVKSHLLPVLVPERFVDDKKCSISARHFGFDDLYLMVKIMDVAKSASDDMTGNTYVYESMLEMWNVSFEEIILDAFANHEDAVIEPLCNVIERICPGLPTAGECPLYISYYPDKNDMPSMYSASSIIANRIKAEEIFPNGYYVIPSSLHEVLIVDSNQPKDFIEDMIKDVNEHEVKDKDILSDHVYLMK